jgi:6,7-dimethyl-8-ribityllumazine synthase
MSQQTLPRQPRVFGGRKTIAIVASRYNEGFVDAMIEAAKAEIEAVDPSVLVPLYRVPGAFEIPSCIELVARRARPHAAIALGVVIRGQTAHADIVARSVATSLLDISREHVLPVINEVLLLDDEKQAEERCYGTRINRGTEAARAALAMVDLFIKIDLAFPSEKKRRGGKA